MSLQNRVPVFCNPKLHCLWDLPQPCKLAEKGFFWESECFPAWIRGRDLQRGDLVKSFHELGGQRHILRSNELNQGLKGLKLVMNLHKKEPRPTKTSWKCAVAKRNSREQDGGLHTAAWSPVRAGRWPEPKDARKAMARKTLAPLQISAIRASRPQ